MFDVRKYTCEDKQIWDSFVKESKNATFLFYRDYMDYHSDRFFDNSLLLYKKKKLCALFPANIKEQVVYSHQGLSYGGLLLSEKSTVKDVLCFFEQIINFYKNEGVKQVFYKSIPYIYHHYPSQEDIYALFTINAQLITRHISSTIDLLNTTVKFSKQRREGIIKALKNKLTVSCSEDYFSFWDILTENLINKFNKPPVHNLKEILLLKGRFPDNIKLYLVYYERMPIAGTVIFITGKTVHVQYISANLEGKKMGALDLLFHVLLNETFKSFSFFDFGQSTEEDGKKLNEGLMFQKEGFGGRGVVYDTYEFEFR